MLSEEEMNSIGVGSRVLVFDPTLYQNDISTPLECTMRPATVQRYGILQHTCGSAVLGPYPDVVDVRFDHRPERVSHSHFTNYLKRSPK